MKEEKQKVQKKKTGGLRRKLLRLMVPTVLITIIILVAIAGVVSGNRMKTMAAETLDSSIENQRDNIESWLDQNLEQFQTVKIAIENMGLEDSEFTDVLNIYYGYNSNSPDGLRIGTSSGKIYKAAGSANYGSNPVNETWYQQGLTSVNLNYGAAYENAEGVKVISATGMLDDGSSEVRVLAADLTLDKISTIVNSGVKMENASAFLVDTAEGTILANPDASLVGVAMSDAATTSLMKGINEKLSIRDYNSDTVAGYLVAFEQISGTDWVLVSYIPTSIVFQTVNQMVLLLIIIGVIAAVIISILISLMISRVIAPLTEITQNITAMSEGDFTIDVTAKSNDEIGEMGASVREFVSKMRQMLTNINEESVKLKAQSDSSDHVSKTMFNDSASQSEAMQNLNETVDQLASAVNEIAENATVLACVVSDTRSKSDRAGESMKATVTLSQEGRDDMRQLSVAMGQIEQSNNELVDSINEVGVASEKITQIVGLISEIAEETNLLSLNASIEAARAGEAGKGFSVVASEIGKLANTSSESATNIANLINQVRSLINEVVAKANTSAENIRSNTELINTAVSTFDKIYENIQESDDIIRAMVSDVDKVNDVASNVAAISEEQAASADEILATSQSMVEKANNITRSSQDVADNSHELANTSDTLTDYVNRFKI